MPLYNLVNCVCIILSDELLYINWSVGRSVYVCQCEACGPLTQQDWVEELPPPSSSSVVAGTVFYEGLFLQVLFDRLGRLLEQVSRPIQFVE
jgi:hypothetical protein